MLAHNNLEEYHDPINYDLEFGGAWEKYAFYIECAKKHPGTVMELACGTGLTALEIAAQGISVVGVDVSLPMLEYTRLKARQLPATFFEGDACDVRMNQHFSLIYLTGNAFQCFLTEAQQQALLNTVKAHMAPKGILVFETRNPSGTDLSLQEHEQPWGTFINANGVLVTVSGTQRYDAAQQIMHWVTIRRWGHEESKTRIACRFTDQKTLAQLIYAEKSGGKILVNFI